MRKDINDTSRKSAEQQMQPGKNRQPKSLKSAIPGSIELVSQYNDKTEYTEGNSAIHSSYDTSESPLAKLIDIYIASKEHIKKDFWHFHLHRCDSIVETVMKHIGHTN